MLYKMQWVGWISHQNYVDFLKSREDGIASIWSKDGWSYQKSGKMKIYFRFSKCAWWMIHKQGKFSSFVYIQTLKYSKNLNKAHNNNKFKWLSFRRVFKVEVFIQWEYIWAIFTTAISTLAEFVNINTKILFLELKMKSHTLISFQSSLKFSVYSLDI